MTISECVLCLPIETAITRWSHYIQNGRPFEVIVDHEALMYLITSAANNGNKRILRYILEGLDL
jgi:hypothetical protein